MVVATEEHSHDKVGNRCYHYNGSGHFQCEVELLQMSHLATDELDPSLDSKQKRQRVAILSVSYRKLR